ncbi:MAG: DUF4189 domain-containing protein [Paracoccaceae bacterium]|nr:DUF4189 domain-containing protein [Paracoccaceae bacterium]
MRLIFLAKALLIAIVTPVFATGSCGYERCFGAFALGEGGEIGCVVGQRTVPDAANLARAICGESCEVEVFWNSCGAIAQSSDGTLYFGWDEMLERANLKALEACQSDEGARGCYVRDWACSK